MNANNNNHTNGTKASDLSFDEAPASFNTRYITPDGFTCQLTLRAESGKELLERANNALTYLREQGMIPFYGYSRENGYHESQHQDNVTENHSNDEPAFCTLHQCDMKQWRKGEKVWWSHKASDGSWCNGKAKNGNKE
jgi:hypothetical protein